MRWQRMAALLQGLEIKRIAAVDGKDIEGSEQRDRSQRLCYEALSRYERACILSHRLACEEFLATGERYGCIFEDDILISHDFPRFINDESWIPDQCNVMKIETTRQPVFISSKSVACFNRRAALLCSLHLGSAAYIVNRAGALALLKATLQPQDAIDRIMYEKGGLEILGPVYQLFPAVCIQADHQPGVVPFPEIESSVRLKAAPGRQPPVIKTQKTFSNKIKRELIRPCKQLKNSVQAAGTLTLDRLRGVHRCSIPFA